MVLQPAPTLHGDPALTPLSAALSYKYREVQRWKIQNTFKSKENVPTPKTAKDAGVGYTVHPLLKTTESFLQCIFQILLLAPAGARYVMVP